MGNLPPGEPAPDTGTYVCCFCGPGGLAEATAIPMRALRVDGPLTAADLLLPVSNRLTVLSFTEGTRLPDCPTCGQATGWDLLTGPLEEHLEHRVATREEVFSTLGITRARPVDPGETALDRLNIITEETLGRLSVRYLRSPDRGNRRIPPGDALGAVLRGLLAPFLPPVRRADRRPARPRDPGALLRRAAAPA